MRRLILSLSGLCKKCRFSTNTVQEVKPFSEIPGPKRLPVIGNLLLFSRFGPYSFDHLYDAYQDFHSQFGPVVRLDLGITMILLFRPEDIQKMFNRGEKYPQRPLFEALRKYRLQRKDLYSCGGLVSENGEEWHRLRRAVSFMMLPAFAQSYFPLQEKVADDFVSYVQKSRDSNGNIPNFLNELYRYTEEAIGLVCFGTRLGLLDESASTEFSSQLTQAADDTMQALADTLLGFPWWKIFKTPTYKKLVRSQDFFQRFASESIEKAKLIANKGEVEANLQFLQKLLENKTLKSTDISLLMTEIFSAGIDATGNSIGFLLYHLARNPSSQEKLYQNIRQFCSNGLNPERISKMVYLKACIQESFRLTPTPGGNARILTSPATFSGYKVPEKVLCLGLHPVICRQEEHFKNPLDFIPERWLNQSGTEFIRTSHPYCVAPFSHGVRRCVGQRFAEQEIRLCVIKIIQRFRVEYDGPEIKSIMRMSLIPDKPLNMKFVDRNIVF